MTSRSDIPRLGASLGVLGTILEDRGQEAWDKIAGWAEGPRRAPADAPDEVCSCGHSIDSHVHGHDVCAYMTERDDGEVVACWCTGFTAAPRGSVSEDRKSEAKQRARAAEHFAEHRTDLNELDRLVQRILRRHDIACPPDLSEIRNRRSREAAPMTPAEAAIEGFCKSCWRDNQHRKEIDVDKNGLKYYRDYCRWCGTAKAEHGIEPPMEMLVIHHTDGGRCNPDEFAAAVAKVKAASKASKKKGKKKNKGWVAA